VITVISTCAPLSDYDGTNEASFYKIGLCWPCSVSRNGGEIAPLELA
jgi:hypothetical protein